MSTSVIDSHRSVYQGVNVGQLLNAALEHGASAKSFEPPVVKFRIPIISASYEVAAHRTVELAQDHPPMTSSRFAKPIEMKSTVFPRLVFDADFRATLHDSQIGQAAALFAKSQNMTGNTLRTLNMVLAAVICARHGIRIEGRGWGGLI